MSEFKTRDAVAAKLRAFCVDQDLVQDPSQIRDEHGLVCDLMADSLDLVELQMFAEEEFGLDLISDAEMEMAKTFGAFVDLVCARLAIPSAAAA